MGIEKLVGNAKVIADVCLQFGDTGKGKVSGLLTSEWADITARGTGGDNAGHTEVVDGVRRVSHVLPASIFYDGAGKYSVLGQGMVINLQSLAREMEEIAKAGLSHGNLRISDNAHLILPHHIDLDSKNTSQANGGIGSTGKGIGPAYAEKIARVGVKLRHLYDPESLQEILTRTIRHNFPSMPDRFVNYMVGGYLADIRKDILPIAESIRGKVIDAGSQLRSWIREGKKVCLEGAQGTDLSIEHGTYPFVTSSDCTTNGLASGVGIPASSIDLVLGVVKFPFMSRVGGGPFPTEIGGVEMEKYCAKNEGNRLRDELKRARVSYQESPQGIVYNHNDVQILWMLNQRDGSTQNTGLRLKANEYGATTGRPRRVGWTDAVAARHASQVNGSPQKLVFTKVDCLSGADEFKIAYAYRLPSGSTTEEFPTDPELLRKVEPVYTTYPGYAMTGREREYDQLPKSLRKAMQDLSDFVGQPIGMVSVGADREANIFV
ncbi:MAG: adenylosuccinate synthetase [Nanoarchaeota archaeon]|nr:adenylosuccinate synthetase [Nanoarchaeota archaeon]